MYDSLANTGRAFSAFDNWYELNKGTFWAWAVVALIFFFIIIVPRDGRAKR